MIFFFLWTFSTWLSKLFLNHVATYRTHFIQIDSSIFCGLSNISDLYWSNQVTCCWMNLVEISIWKTNWQLLAPSNKSVKKHVENNHNEEIFQNNFVVPNFLLVWFHHICCLVMKLCEHFNALTDFTEKFS